MANSCFIELFGLLIRCFHPQNSGQYNLVYSYVVFESCGSKTIYYEKDNLITYLCNHNYFLFHILRKDIPKKGCTDSKALNHNSDADTNDGSCQYSTVIFLHVCSQSRPACHCYS
jgi:hypothetical protein